MPTIYLENHQHACYSNLEQLFIDLKYTIVSVLYGIALSSWCKPGKVNTVIHLLQGTNYIVPMPNFLDKFYEYAVYLLDTNSIYMAMEKPALSCLQLNSVCLSLVCVPY